MRQESTPKVITREAEARGHFRDLIKAGFEIFQASRPLTEEEFVKLALRGGVEVVVRPIHDMGGTGSQEERADLAQMTEPEAVEVYSQLSKIGKGIFLLPKRVSEEEFVVLAASRGRVDLRRVSPVNLKVTVAYGAEIGFSRFYAQILPLPEESGYIM